MTYSEKIDTICRRKGIKRIQLAQKLGLDYSGMNRKIKAQKISMVLIEGIAKEYPDVNLNWLFSTDTYKIEETITLVSEPENDDESIYAINPTKSLQKAIDLLEKIKANLTQK